MFEQLLISTIAGLGLYFLIAWVVNTGLLASTKACHFCKGRINKDATVCPQCAREQPLLP